MATLYFSTNRNARRRGTRIVDFGKETPEVTDDFRVGRFRVDWGNPADAEAAAEAVEDAADRHVRIQMYSENHRTQRVGSVQLFEHLRRKMVSGQDVLLYVHGYSVTFREAMAAGGGLEWHFRRPRAERSANVVCFTWPSDGSMSPWKAYKSDRHDATVSGPALGRALLKMRDYLQDRVEGECRGRIGLIAHSMGAYALQQALLYVRTRSLPQCERLFDEAILIAADVDHDALEHDSKLGTLPEVASRVTLYTNADDRALALSNHTKGNSARLGRTGPRNRALIPSNVEVVDWSAVQTSITKHHYYLEPAVLADMAAIMRGPEMVDTPGRHYVPERGCFRLG